jgi:PHD/YefM family antitoxin component YafN of YafNO toxin-antitoxin module
MIGEVTEMKTLTLKEAQALYNALTDDQATLEPVLVERDGKPIGVFVPMAEYEAFRAWRESEHDRQPASTHNEAFQREAAAFERMMPELLRQYRNRVVAIYNGQVVEVGSENESVADVAMRVYERLGYISVYVHRVEETPRIYKISSPQIVRQ